MWIRSQDRESLLNVKAISVEGNAILGLIDGGELGHGGMGVYSTKERAIEVLDEIQGVIFNGVQIIYEMPQE